MRRAPEVPYLPLVNPLLPLRHGSRRFHPLRIRTGLPHQPVHRAVQNPQPPPARGGTGEKTRLPRSHTSAIPTPSRHPTTRPGRTRTPPCRSATSAPAHPSSTHHRTDSPTPNPRLPTAPCPGSQSPLPRTIRRRQTLRLDRRPRPLLRHRLLRQIRLRARPHPSRCPHRRRLHHRRRPHGRWLLVPPKTSLPRPHPNPQCHRHPSLLRRHLRRPRLVSIPRLHHRLHLRSDGPHHRRRLHHRHPGQS